MLGIIVAMKKEFTLLEKEFILGKKEIIGMIEFYIGTVKNKKVIIGFSGVGKVNAAICTQLLISHYGVDVILNYGIAGALSKELSVGDIIIATGIVQHDFDTTEFGEPKGWVENLKTNILEPSESINKELFLMDISNSTVVLGKIISGDKFVARVEDRNALRKEFLCIACDMECGAIAQVCLQNEIPFAVIKSISDNINENSGEDYQKNLDASVEKVNDFVVKYICKIF